jgi:hypothetical protein
MTTPISSFASKVSPEVDGCPSFVVTSAVIDAIQKFCADTNIIKRSFEHTVDYTTIDSADNDSITIPLSDYVSNLAPLSVSEFKIDGADYGLIYKEVVVDHSDITEISIQGCKFYNFVDQDSMLVFPFNDVSSDFNLFVGMAFKPKDSITSIDDFFFYDHREAIKAFALYTLQSMGGKTWTDLKQAAKNLSIYRSRMGDARVSIESDRIIGTTTMKIPFF